MARYGNWVTGYFRLFRDITNKQISLDDAWGIYSLSAFDVIATG